MPSEDPKIAVLTGGTSEFTRWKTAAQVNDNPALWRVVDAPVPHAIRVSSIICLPSWRNGYRFPDPILEMIKNRLIVRTRGGGVDIETRPILTPSAADNDILVEAGPSFDTFSQRSDEAVFLSYGLPAHAFLGHDSYRRSLVAMMRLNDETELIHATNTNRDFIGFCVQYFAYILGRSNRVGIAAHGFPSFPDSLPAAMVQCFPVDVARAALVRFGVAQANAEMLPNTQARQLGLQAIEIEIGTANGNSMVRQQDTLTGRLARAIREFGSFRGDWSLGDTPIPMMPPPIQLARTIPPPERNTAAENFVARDAEMRRTIRQAIQEVSGVPTPPGPRTVPPSRRRNRTAWEP